MPVMQEFDDRLEADSFTHVGSWTPAVQSEFGRRVAKYVADAQDDQGLGDSVRITIKVESLDKGKAIKDIKQSTRYSRDDPNHPNYDE